MIELELERLSSMAEISSTIIFFPGSMVCCFRVASDAKELMDDAEYYSSKARAAFRVVHAFEE